MGAQEEGGAIKVHIGYAVNVSVVETQKLRMLQRLSSKLLRFLTDIGESCLGAFLAGFVACKFP